MILSLLPSIVILGLAALAAVYQTLTHRPRSTSRGTLKSTAVALAIAASIQAVHFTEEALTDFPGRLGALLGIPAMPMSFFLTFNLCWLTIWAASVPGLRSARPWAFFAAWFLAIAGIINGVAHPALAIASGDYFPGLVTSPFIGVAGIWLLRQLKNAVSPWPP
jgi:formate hydrogenlyase subunit 3/multisubunit Na+/H+ antiporter MnhD subunit